MPGEENAQMPDSDQLPNDNALSRTFAAMFGKGKSKTDDPAEAEEKQSTVLEEASAEVAEPEPEAKTEDSETPGGEEQKAVSGEDAQTTSVADGEETQETPTEKTLLEEQLAAQNAIIEDLRKQISEIAATTTPREEKKAETPSAEAFRFSLGDADFDNVIAEPDVFEEVFNKALVAHGQHVEQQILRAIPETVTHYIAQERQNQAIFEAYLEEYPDLRPHVPLVNHQAQQLGQERPELLNTPEFGTALATRCRGVLALQAQADATAKMQQYRKPTQPKVSGTRSAMAPPQVDPKMQKINAAAKAARGIR